MLDKSQVGLLPHTEGSFVSKVPQEVLNPAIDLCCVHGSGLNRNPFQKKWKDLLAGTQQSPEEPCWVEVVLLSQDSHESHHIHYSNDGEGSALVLPSHRCEEQEEQDY